MGCWGWVTGRDLTYIRENTQLLAEPVYSRRELGSKRRLPPSTKADGAQGEKKQLATWADEKMTSIRSKLNRQQPTTMRRYWYITRGLSSKSRFRYRPW